MSNSTVRFCVTGCGAVGTRYTTDPAMTACDEHAHAKTRDVEYADIVRATALAEREACAKHLEDIADIERIRALLPVLASHYRQAAAAIRARGAK